MIMIKGKNERKAITLKQFRVKKRVYISRVFSAWSREYTKMLQFSSLSSFCIVEIHNVQKVSRVSVCVSMYVSISRKKDQKFYEHILEFQRSWYTQVHNVFLLYSICGTYLYICVLKKSARGEKMQTHVYISRGMWYM